MEPSCVFFSFSVETEKGGVVPNTLISMPTSSHMHSDLRLRDSDLIAPANHLEPGGPRLLILDV